MSQTKKGSKLSTWQARYVAGLAFLIMLSAPVAAWSQCYGTMTNSGTSMGNPTVSIRFTHPVYPINCSLNMSMGGATCQAILNDTIYPLVGSLKAIGMAGAGPQSCSWMCTCGGTPSSYVANNANGLPVELLDFKVSALEPTTHIESKLARLR